MLEALLETPTIDSASSFSSADRLEEEDRLTIEKCIYLFNQTNYQSS